VILARIREGGLKVLIMLDERNGKDVWEAVF
jgi:hypothetical protein